MRISCKVKPMNRTSLFASCSLVCLEEGTVVCCHLTSLLVVYSATTQNCFGLQSATTPKSDAWLFHDELHSFRSLQEFAKFSIWHCHLVFFCIPYGSHSAHHLTSSIIHQREQPLSRDDEKTKIDVIISLILDIDFGSTCASNLHFTLTWTLSESPYKNCIF